MLASWRINSLVQCLDTGGVIACPTEGVFGLSCAPLDLDAVRRILNLKQRSMTKGLILIAANWAQLEPWVAQIPTARLQTILATWPGPNTWLFPPKSQVPYWLTGNHDRLAIRVTSHPLVAELCSAYGGAVVSTSANPGGMQPAVNARRVRCYFPTQLDAILTADCLHHGQPSSIRDALSGQVIRP